MFSEAYQYLRKSEAIKVKSLGDEFYPERYSLWLDLTEKDTFHGEVC